MKSFGSSDQQPSVAPKERRVSDIYRELHHYTNWHGLEGILKSQTLWATYYTHLNDYTEITHLKDFMAEAVAENVREYIKERCKESASIRKRVRDGGGALRVARHDISGWMDVLYRTTFLGGGSSDVPFISPYITSFCAHGLHYERKHGLLSQWRGYGGKERYSLVFSTKELEKALELEANEYDYNFLGLTDVVYNEDLKLPHPELDLVATQIRQLFIDDVEGVRRTLGPLLENYLKLSSRFKHRGFKEESEVRIIACPMIVKLREYLATQGAELPSPLKPIKSSFVKAGKKHIAINENIPKRDLPILRIIVGPHQSQVSLVEKIKGLLINLGSGKHIEITRSETPLRDEVD